MHHGDQEFDILNIFEIDILNIFEFEIYLNFVIKSYQSMDLIPNPPILGSGP